MTVYKVGDHVEQIDLVNGELVDTGVVVRIDGNDVWTLFDSCKGSEYYFYSDDASFRLKRKLKLDQMKFTKNLQSSEIFT